jgi:hypothetical protein
VRTPKLTDAELDDLTEALGRFRNERAMNLEALDGFIAVLICGPCTIPRSEFCRRYGAVVRWPTQRASLRRRMYSGLCKP